MILRMKMSPADRAKQFMPFAALKGYEEALRMVEWQLEQAEAGDQTEETQEEFLEDA